MNLTTLLRVFLLAVLALLTIIHHMGGDIRIGELATLLMLTAIYFKMCDQEKGGRQ
ncbi:MULTISPECIES: hypothetical protein [Brevibacillus]|uniref:Uncharacterized protein n=1 Tax=Brevibacillus laterosporus TaxID=1465 RepID=A0AAP3G912_BRELA|nr:MULTISPECIES: hypothetical protein [Brevibacillus]MBA4535117.1 hypothetical protein [Brevibacillus halotolerans]MCR8980911.1 hypothetical protein [Brevibacillus laterosporus]MCZ0808066.1 hypothetical protein [Brevibacillus laterosporus]MCZ0826258.1 hypothetical protein [Brevibacillus laterosporus]MCZ0850141.1 hypothetical protein [Brevibacillus laterosporus]